MADKTRVLFICAHNSGRSQIAAAYLKKLGGGNFEVESAGLDPANEINPLVVEVMKEEGIDISKNKTQSVFDLYKQGRLFDYVITVCDDTTEAKCPIFPGIVKRWHWPFADPAAVSGSDGEKMAQVRKIRDQIKEKLLNPSEKDFSFSDLLRP